MAIDFFSIDFWFFGHTGGGGQICDLFGCRLFYLTDCSDLYHSAIVRPPKNLHLSRWLEPLNFKAIVTRRSVTVSFWFLISDRVDVIFSFQRIPAKIAKTNFHLKYKKILFSNFTHLVIAVIVAVIIFPLDMVNWCRLTNSKKFDQSCGKQQKVLVFYLPFLTTRFPPGRSSCFSF